MKDFRMSHFFHSTYTNRTEKVSWKFRVGKNDTDKVKLTIFKHSVITVFCNEQILFSFILAGIIFKYFHKLLTNNYQYFKTFFQLRIFKLIFKPLIVIVAFNQQIMLLVCTGCHCALRKHMS